MKDLLFSGAPQLLRLFDRLTQRKWRDTDLPFVHLIREDPQQEPFRGLLDRLRHAGRSKSPYAEVILGPGDVQPTPGIPVVKNVFDRAVTDLGTHGRQSYRLRFPRYILSSWICDLKPAPEVTDCDQLVDEIGRRLRDRLFGRRASSAQAGPGNTIQDVAAGLPWFLLIIPVAWTWWRNLAIRYFLSAPRFIARQRPSEIHAGSFVQLAFALSQMPDGPRKEQILNDLLVSSFLEDLRQGYRGLAGRLRMGRRHPTLFLAGEGAGAEAAYKALDAITQIRNGFRSRRPHLPVWDPLLIITTLPPAVQAIRAHPPTDAGIVHEEWLHRLRRDGSRRTWSLPFRLPSSVETGVYRTDLHRVGLPPCRLPLVMITFFAVLVFGLGGVSTFNIRHCQAFMSMPRADVHREALRGDRYQCIGFITDPADIDTRLVGPDEGFARITEMNRKVKNEPEWYEVVYFSMLESGDHDGYLFAREELRGIAIAQQKLFREGTPVYIHLVNSGDLMEHSARAAQEIVEMAEKNRRLIAALGFGLSKRQTAHAVVRLGRIGLSTLGTSTSADAMSDLPGYRQVGPNNLRIARAAVEYAVGELESRFVRIYYSGNTEDIYSENLAMDARVEFSGRGIEVTEILPYHDTTPSAHESAGDLGEQACAAKTGEFVFYAGRSEEFSEFLGGMQRACRNTSPRVLAADDITRWVLNGDYRTYPGVELDYISFASSIAFGKNCTKDPASFYTSYAEVFPKGSACKDAKDGQAAIAYDAMLVLQQGIEDAKGKDTGAEIRSALFETLGQIRGGKKITGVTGDLDYGDDRFPGAPKDKAVLILHAAPTGPCLAFISGSFFRKEKRVMCS
ncbi:type 1 periplasmic-binding domain-containing protein [Actinocorallia populi]|uniref:ABC transporter substrate-binding protein n=1 Tax=Actinocorallia populi TaxID=2079200 RepID=UPI000D086D6E|nr:ABC transporter substrate-binding protein [Actinocorallia populi]